MKCICVFVGVCSHEFRTPLMGPLEDSLCDIQSPLPPAQRQRLELVYRNALRLLKHVNSLLDFSRVQASRIQAVFEPTNMSELTCDLASVFRALIERAGVWYVVDVESLEEVVYLDGEMYEKIVFNLLR